MVALTLFNLVAAVGCAYYAGRNANKGQQTVPLAVAALNAVGVGLGYIVACQQ